MTVYSVSVIDVKLDLYHLFSKPDRFSTTYDVILAPPLSFGSFHLRETESRLISTTSKSSNSELESEWSFNHVVQKRKNYSYEKFKFRIKNVHFGFKKNFYFDNKWPGWYWCGLLSVSLEIQFQWMLEQHVSLSKPKASFILDGHEILISIVLPTSMFNHLNWKCS